MSAIESPQITPGTQDAVAPENDRRGALRFPILQRCFARTPETLPALAWKAIAYNISTTGIGITLPCPVEPGTVLEVEAWKLPRARRLQVRVVHTRLYQLHWFCGCELLAPLTEEELLAWRAGPTNWLDKPY